MRIRGCPLSVCADASRFPLDDRLMGQKPFRWPGWRGRSTLFIRQPSNKSKDASMIAKVPKCQTVNVTAAREMLATLRHAIEQVAAAPVVAKPVRQILIANRAFARWSRIKNGSKDHALAVLAWERGCAIDPAHGPEAVLTKLLPLNLKRGTAWVWAEILRALSDGTVSEIELIALGIAETRKLAGRRDGDGSPYLVKDAEVDRYVMAFMTGSDDLPSSHVGQLIDRIRRSSREGSGAQLLRGPTNRSPSSMRPARKLIK